MPNNIAEYGNGYREIYKSTGFWKVE